jgi:hypothetical protein
MVVFPPTHSLPTLTHVTSPASTAFAHDDDDWREHRGDHGRHFYQPYYPPQAVIVERPIGGVVGALV